MGIDETSNDRDIREGSKGEFPARDYKSATPEGRSSFTPLGIGVTAAVSVGISIGVPLAVISFSNAGGGHGSYLISFLASSPLSLAQSSIVSWLGTPFVWAALAGLATKAAHRAGAVAFVLAMSCHYLVNLFFLHEEYLELGRGGWRFEWPGLAVYAAGQLTLWTIFVFALRRRIRIPEDPRYWAE